MAEDKALVTKYYLEKLEALIRGELIVNKQEGNKLAVEGTLNLDRFLECYINTRKEIKYEFIAKVMDLPDDKCSRGEFIKLLREMIEEEPKVDPIN